MTDNRGGTHTSTQDVVTTMPPNQQPTAAFTSDVDQAVRGVHRRVDRCRRHDQQVLWDFGDGNTSTETNPTQIYGAAATYTVKLMVTDDGAVSDAVEHDVVAVANVAPTAAFTPSNST